MQHPTHDDPFAGNPLRTRADLQRAVVDMAARATPFLSASGARMQLGGASQRYTEAGAEMEGMARHLWGLAPLLAGGGTLGDWDRFVEGIAAGTDPGHPEYWGVIADFDQRMVEMASIGFTFALLGQRVWSRFDGPTRGRIAAWFGQINVKEPVKNNWQFFRVLVNLGLRRVDAPHDWAATERSLATIDSFELGRGWSFDGRPGQRDHYIAFAIHFYGLIYARLGADVDPARAARYRERAAAFAQTYRSWFAADGAALPFGRSLTYRFAKAAFWGALAFADVEALPWSEIKGVHHRHLRWWQGRPVFDRDGILSIGYGYPNALMSEQYNALGSPYWAMKAFLPLALPATHPFWAAEETADPDPVETVAIPEALMIVQRGGGHAVALGVGQQNEIHRGGAEKYAKFAYSTHFAFSVESMFRWGEAVGDNALLLTDDGVHVRTRERHEAAQVTADVAYSRWQPWEDVTVESWVLPRHPWHVRIHRIHSARGLTVQEGGFALPIDDDESPPDIFQRTSDAPAFLVSRAGFSGLVDGSGGRTHRATLALPSTNLLHRRTIVPKLEGVIPPGEPVTWITAVLGTPRAQDGAAAWPRPPDLADCLRSVGLVRAP